MKTTRLKEFFKLPKGIIRNSFVALLLFSIPLIIVICFCFFYCTVLKEFIKESITFLLLTLTLFFFITVTPKCRLKKFLYAFFWIILALLSFIKVSFYHIFGVRLSASSVFVIFETNGTEVSEFLKTYTSPTIILLAICYLIVCYLTIKFTCNNKKFFYVKIRVIHSIILIIISGCFLFTINKKANDYSLLFSGVNYYYDYKHTKKILKEQLGKPKSSFTKVTSSRKESQTHVVIIGESTSRWHMQLYGYNRKTNPKLSEIKDSLIIFDSVIAPNVHTILSLEKILSHASINDINKKNNASIVQLANMAGFSTFWISNQRPVGIHESISTLISNAASIKNYIETDNYNAAIHDENILPYLEEVLNYDTHKKLIFIQLMGTHIKYKLRYPKKYEVFKDSPNTAFSSKGNIDIINSYDNAVLYNDYIVRTIIDKVAAKETSSVVIYFSDHGDEVFDTTNFLGHSEAKATKPMYEVPLIAWMSPKYKEQNTQLINTENILHRKYNLEDFIHSYSDILEIKHTKWDSTKSIFSPYFKNRKRLVKKGEDYDKIYKK